MTKHARRPLISGNWKMHLNHFEAISAVQKLEYLLHKEDTESVDVSIHPPFTDLRSVQTLIDADKVRVSLGAQNCHWEDKGAFTGEVSPIFLSKLNVSYVIAGHSERRELFGETDETVNKKVRAIIAQGMTPILCVGETLEEREAGQTEPKVLGQLEAGLAGLSAEQVGHLVVAYEPIWAIGTGRTASTADAQTVCGALRKKISELHGSDAAAAVRIQYGGSVKPSNIAELMAERDIDGALVGGASLDPDEFIKIVRLGRE
ncbi:MAG: tpiA [Acidimicrobiia bacterium]|nr:tpiA [Acidimicrobiia bacterium]